MNKKNANALRAAMAGVLVEALEAKEFEVLQVGSASYSIPVVAEDGEEGYATISVVMRDKDRDGEAYDGYLDAQMYKEHAEEVAAKAAERTRAAEQKKADALKRKLEKEAKARAKEKAEELAAD